MKLDIQIHNIFKAVLQKVNRWKFIFIIDIIIASFTYSLLMINQLVNRFDGLWHGSISYANGWELSIGRWFLRFLDIAKFYLSPDPTSSIISLILFSLSIILVLDFFDMESNAYSIFISLTFLISTTVCVILSYRFTSVNYALGCFLSIFSAWLFIKMQSRLGMLLAILSLSIMMGCYQANIGCTCLLLLIYVPYKIYQNQMSIKQFLLYFIKAILFLILGGIVYCLLLYVNLLYFNQSLNNYRGADEYNIFNIITHLPESIIQTYTDFFSYYSNSLIKINMFSNKLYLCLFIILFCVILIPTRKIFKDNLSLLIIYLLSFCCIPLACNSSLLLAHNTITMIQMTMPMVLCIPVLLCFVSKLSIHKRYQNVITKAILGILISFIIYGKYAMVQYDQQAMYMGLQATKTIADEVQTRLLQMDLFHPSNNYCFIGRPSENALFYVNDAFLKANDYARFGDFGVLPDCVRQSWYGFWRYEKGININIVDDNVYNELIGNETVRQMSVFPEQGSCQLINDVVVVKLGENY